MKLYTNVSVIFIIWLFSVLLIGYLGFSVLPHSGYFKDNFWQSLGNWDGGHYLGIAQNGYSQKYQYAFFPLYPLTIRFLTGITSNYLLSAILISLASSFLAINLIYKYILKTYDKITAERSIVYLLFFPASFFLVMAYSEGLFLLFTAGVFYFLYRKKLFWATIFSALASATRLVGLALVFGLWIEVLSKEGLTRKNWYIIFAPLGFVIYSSYLYQQTGDPFYFIQAQNHWQRTLSTPGAGFWETLKYIFVSGYISSHLTVVVDLVLAIFGMGLAIRGFRFLPSSLAVFTLLSVLTPQFSPTLTSIPRFLSVVFPLFIVMALVKNQYVRSAYQILGLMLLAFFIVIFFTGHWVS